MKRQTKRDPFIPEHKPYVPQPCEHPYADCTSCYGSGLARSFYSDHQYPCESCERRYAAAVAKRGAAWADAERRILAIEKRLACSWELPRELKAKYAKKPKPLSAEATAALEAHFLSDLNREYLACLKVYWS